MLSLSESIRVHRRRSDDMENVEDNEDEAQRCLGPEDINIRTKEQENTCGLLYYEDRSTGTALKQCHIKFQGVSPLVPVQFSWNKETIITTTLMGHGHSPNG